MKGSQLLWTTVIVLSLPALGLAQATGGSTDKLLKNHKGGAPAGTGTKGTAQPEIHRKGAGNAPKNAGTLNPQPLPPINHAPLAEKGSGNTPKTTGTVPPPKAGNTAGKVYRKGSGTGRKGKLEQTDTGKKPTKGAPQTQQ